MALAQKEGEFHGRAAWNKPSHGVKLAGALLGMGEGSQARPSAGLRGRGALRGPSCATPDRTSPGTTSVLTPTPLESLLSPEPGLH